MDKMRSPGLTHSRKRHLRDVGLKRHSRRPRLAHVRRVASFVFRADELGMVQESSQESVMTFGMVTVCRTRVDSNLSVTDGEQGSTTFVQRVPILKVQIVQNARAADCGQLGAGGVAIPLKFGFFASLRFPSCLPRKRISST